MAADLDPQHPRGLNIQHYMARQGARQPIGVMLSTILAALGLRSRFLGAPELLSCLLHNTSGMDRDLARQMRAVMCPQTKPNRTEIAKCCVFKTLTKVVRRSKQKHYLPILDGRKGASEGKLASEFHKQDIGFMPQSIQLQSESMLCCNGRYGPRVGRAPEVVVLNRVIPCCPWKQPCRPAL
eukprot:2548490-Amphidinium_carterae.1